MFTIWGVGECFSNRERGLLLHQYYIIIVIKIIIIIYYYYPIQMAIFRAGIFELATFDSRLGVYLN